MKNANAKLTLDTPVSEIGKIGTKYVTKLKKLGIFTLQDILFHFPRRYDDYSKIVPIADVFENENCTVIGKITKTKNFFGFKKKIGIFEITIEDETGIIRAVWFNQPFLANSLKEGLHVAISGKAVVRKGLIFTNPIHEIIHSDNNSVESLVHTGRLIPIYPETSGVSSRWFRFVLKSLLQYSNEIVDYLPDNIIKENKLLALNDAVLNVHRPKNLNIAKHAQKRLGFDEIFLIQLLLLSQKQKWHQQKAMPIKFNQPLVKEFVNNLLFTLTNSQRRSLWEILQDLEKSTPMNRLLEGDVGSGKTVVSAISALQTIKAGYQSALMAPTEILANQHYKTISNALGKYDINIALLTSSQPKGAKAKKQLLNDLKNGNIQFLIGTHALIQESVKFKNLALAIIDEQHRFGVMQRASLLKNITDISDGLPNTVPHLLSMTATPIPRTLALTAYGDLDLSLLDEMPPGRQKIITDIVISKEKREKTYNFVRQEIKKGRQAFVVCPRIESSENQSENAKSLTDIIKAEIKAVKSEYEKLSTQIFPDLNIAMLHGKMKSAEKAKIMKEFSNGQTDILISTSVIEVGIDVSNATIMLIEGAERFGLAQLHQLRGRVGRSNIQSYCFVLTSLPSENERLNALCMASNGFELAEYDLKLRGPGQFYGTQQWGMPDLAMSSLGNPQTVKQARLSAQTIIAQDKALKLHPALLKRLGEFKTFLHKE